MGPETDDLKREIADLREQLTRTQEAVMLCAHLAIKAATGAASPPERREEYYRDVERLFESVHQRIVGGTETKDD